MEIKYIYTCETRYFDFRFTKNPSCINYFLFKGDNISEEEAITREEKYKIDNQGCYIYFNVVGEHGKFW